MIKTAKRPQYASLTLKINTHFQRPYNVTFLGLLSTELIITIGITPGNVAEIGYPKQTRNFLKTPFLEPIVIKIGEKWLVNLYYDRLEDLFMVK